VTVTVTQFPLSSQIYCLEIVGPIPTLEQETTLCKCLSNLKALSDMPRLYSGLHSTLESELPVLLRLAAWLRLQSTPKCTPLPVLYMDHSACNLVGNLTKNVADSQFVCTNIGFEIMSRPLCSVHDD
jgi:hypothetical protein